MLLLQDLFAFGVHTCLIPKIHICTQFVLNDVRKQDMAF